MLDPKGNPSSAHTQMRRDLNEKRFQIALALACVALFLAAPIFALLTWQTEYTFLMSRHHSFPIMAAETVVVVVAGIIGGFRLLSAGIISSNDHEFSSASEPMRRSSADQKLEQADG